MSSVDQRRMTMPTEMTLAQFRRQTADCSGEFLILVHDEDEDAAVKVTECRVLPDKGIIILAPVSLQVDRTVSE